VGSVHRICFLLIIKGFFFLPLPPQVKAWYFIQKKLDEKINSLKINSFSRKHNKIDLFCSSISF
jgi:hypothetical protein